MTPEARAILLARAERLARRPPDAVARTLFERIAVVVSAGRQFGLAVENIREITALPKITPLPGVTAGLLGVCQVRGDLLGVVDLGARLGLDGTAPKRLAVMSVAGRPLGLAVDAVVAVRDVFADELAEGFTRTSDRPIRAMTRDLVSIVDLQALEGRNEDE